MNKISWIIVFLSVSFTGFGQELDELLQVVVQQNPRLKALEKWLEAEEVRAKTGVYPDNPEVNYAYLFGNNEAMGDQKELEVMQSLKLPGFYTSKSEIQQLQFEQKIVLVQQERQLIIHTARTAFLNLVWLNKKKMLLESRKNESEKLVEVMKQGFDSGEVSKPEFDKARFYNLNVQSGWQKVVSDINIQAEQLNQLSGGMWIDSLILEYPSDWQVMPLDSLVSLLPSENPALVMAGLTIEENGTNIKYEKVNKLPSFEAGYRSEKILNQKLQGFQAGIEIPLWENKNRLKQAKIQYEWSHANYREQESRILSELFSRYNEVQNLQNIYSQMMSIVGDESVSESSLQLLQSGHISFPEYLLDVQFVWDVKNEFLETERNYHIAVSRLKQLFLFD